MKVVLFYDFSRFLKLRENTLDFEVGEITKVESKNGLKNVVVYATFEMSEEEFEAAKIEMHLLYKNLGLNLNMVNMLCERIQSNMAELLRNKTALKTVEERLEKKMFNIAKSMKKCI